jgi:hypothetical protein
MPVTIQMVASKPSDCNRTPVVAAPTGTAPRAMARCDPLTRPNNSGGDEQKSEGLEHDVIDRPGHKDRGRDGAEDGGIRRHEKQRHEPGAHPEERHAGGTQAEMLLNDRSEKRSEDRA